MKKKPSHFYENEDELLNFTAQDCRENIISGLTVEWNSSSSPWQPRILGDARSEKMQVKMNVSIKFRESFRPFAPSVLKERVKDYQNRLNLLHTHCRSREGGHSEKTEPRGVQSWKVKPSERVAICRSTVPAITHVDYSARVQTVAKPEMNATTRLIKRLETITGCGLVVNTSFNIKVNHRLHASRCIQVLSLYRHGRSCPW